MAFPKGYLAPAALTLSMLFQTAAFAGGPSETAAESHTVRAYKNDRSPHTLYASPETHARLGSVLTERLAQWAGQPLMVVAQDDVYSGGGNLQGKEKMKQILESFPAFSGPVRQSGEMDYFSRKVAETLKTPEPTSFNFNDVTGRDGQGCVVTLHDMKTTPEQFANKFLGDVKGAQVRNLPGDAASWHVFMYLHEVAGHCARAHREGPPLAILGAEIDADIIAVEKYNELRRAGIDLDPSVPRAMMDMRAILGLLSSPNETSYRIAPRQINTHATNIAVEFQGKGMAVRPEDSVRGILMANARIHELVGGVFAERTLAEMKKSDPKAAFEFGINQGRDSGKLKKSTYSLGDIKSSPVARAMVGEFISSSHPAYHAAAAQALLESHLVAPDTVAYSALNAYVNAVKRLLPEMVDDALTEEVRAYIQSRSSASLVITARHERSILPLCPLDKEGMQVSGPQACLY